MYKVVAIAEFIKLIQPEERGKFAVEKVTATHVMQDFHPEFFVKRSKSGSVTPKNKGEINSDIRAIITDIYPNFFTFTTNIANRLSVNYV